MSNLLRRHLEINVHFVIKFQERLFGFIIESSGTNIDRLRLVTKDAVGTDDMNQTTSGNDLFDTTIIEGFTNDISPINKPFAEVTIFYTQIQSNTFKDLLFGGRSI